MMNQDNSLDTFKGARKLKDAAIQNNPILRPTEPPSAPRLKTSEDNLIITLRAKGIPWADIVTSLNQRRLAHKEAPTWTEAATYSRFILNNSLTATPAKEIGFEPQDYAYLKNANSGSESASKAGKKRVKDFQNATELSANVRKPATIEGVDGKRSESQSEIQRNCKGKAKARGKKTDEERRKGESEGEVVKMDEGMVEVLMRAVAKVERNFWVFVADEVERESGKFVEARELEKVFHAV